MRKFIGYFIVILVTALATWMIAALLTNIQERKVEGRWRQQKVVELAEDTVDPIIFG